MSEIESTITDPKKQLNYYKDLSEQLQQKNKLLEERVEYLERSNERREETILSLRDEQQLDMYKKLIDEIKFDIQFCINGMKNEYICIDKRTNRELHTMVKILEESISKIDKVIIGEDVNE